VEVAGGRFEDQLVGVFDHTSIIKTILSCFCPDALKQPARRTVPPSRDRLPWSGARERTID
jgi:hypothetical protein